MAREEIDVWAKRHDGQVHKVLDGYTIDNMPHVLTDHDHMRASWMYKAVGKGYAYVALCDAQGGCASSSLNEYRKRTT